MTAKSERKSRGPAGVTARQRQALSMAADGHSFKVIANVLGIGRGAVVDRIQAARVHLQAKSLTHAVALAMRHGLIR